MKIKREKIQFCFSLILILLICIICMGCGTERFSSQMEEKKETDRLTLLIYICGSSLETNFGSATKALEEMKKANLPDDVNVCIELGGADEWQYSGISGARNYYIAIEDNEIQIKEDISSRDMGNPNTYQAFADWAIKNYPADHYATIFWDHGSGSFGNICYDQQYMNHLDRMELEQCIQYLGKNVGEKLEFVGFDACLMANYETARMVSQYAKYMIASEEKEPDGGWDYSKLISALGEQDFYEIVLDSYAKKCELANKKTYTLSVIDLDRISELDEAMQTFYDMLDKTDAIYVTGAVVNAVKFGTNKKATYTSQIDIGSFAEGLGVSEVSKALSQVITCKNGEYSSKATGLSIYFPLSTRKDLEDYLKLSDNEKYNLILENYVSEVGNVKVQFLNRGLKLDNKLNAAITQDSIDNLVRADYVVCQVAPSDYASSLQYLGYSTSVLIEKDNSLSADFVGEWMTVQDTIVTCILANEEKYIEEYIIYAEINGLPSYLMLEYEKDKNQYTLEGYIPRSEAEEIDRIMELQKGDEIQLCNLVKDVDEDVYSVAKVGKSFSYMGEIEISRAQLPDGYYSVVIEFCDMALNIYYSDTAIIKCENGEYEIIKIIKSMEEKYEEQ